MKRNSFIVPKEDNTIIDLTPLVDVVLVLLIFFMVATTFSTNKTLDIKLPKTKTIEKNSEVKAIKILVDAEKNVFLSYEKDSRSVEEKITDRKLKETLLNVLRNNNEKNISLIAHKSLDYGYIVSLMEEIKGAGAQGLNIETEGEK